MASYAKSVLKPHHKERKVWDRMNKSSEEFTDKHIVNADDQSLGIDQWVPFFLNF